MGKPKVVETKASKRAVGKTGGRAKAAQAVSPCITCGKPAFPVLFYPSKGKPRNARGCELCKQVWDTLTLAILAFHVAFTKGLS